MSIWMIGLKDNELQLEAGQVRKGNEKWWVMLLVEELVVRGGK